MLKKKKDKKFLSFYDISIISYINTFHDIICFVSKQKLLLWFSTGKTYSGYILKYSDFQIYFQHIKSFIGNDWGSVALAA